MPDDLRRSKEIAVRVCSHFLVPSLNPKAAWKKCLVECPRLKARFVGPSGRQLKGEEVYLWQGDLPTEKRLGLRQGLLKLQVRETRLAKARQCS